MKRRRWILILLSLLASVGVLLFWREERLEEKFAPQIRAAAAIYSVDPLLIKAVVWRESRFNPNARGTSGEIGLMQIQEIAAQEWADADHNTNFIHAHCFDPGTNTLAATFYLAKLLKRYAKADDPVPYALADYNAGRGNLLKWNSGAAATNSEAFIAQIGFHSTQAYVESVLRRREVYRLLKQYGLE